LLFFSSCHLAPQSFIFCCCAVSGFAALVLPSVAALSLLASDLASDLLIFLSDFSVLAGVVDWANSATGAATISAAARVAATKALDINFGILELHRGIQRRFNTTGITTGSFILGSSSRLGPRRCNRILF